MTRGNIRCFEVLAAAVAVAGVVACGTAPPPFTVDGGVAIDAGLTLDAGFTIDAGPVVDPEPPLDGGPIGDGTDAVDGSVTAESPTDAGQAPRDAGAPASADAGGQPRADAGTSSAVPCPTDSVAIETFCIDRYEAPNVAGARPLAMQTAHDGEAWCSARGKRLCSEAEWVRACRGPAGLSFPYGPTYARGRCNDDKTWRSPSWSVLGTWPSDASRAEAERLYQADPSAQREGCLSAEGVVDLTGNVAEWVVRSFPNANNYPHVMKGCYWAGCYGGAPPSCGFVNPAHPGGFRTYEAGFRCCKTR